MKFIQTQDDLNGIIKNLNQSKYLSVDTEADSLHHYYEKLCLIQISTKSDDYVVDTLAKLDFKELIQVLASKPMICHGADFDLRMIHRFFKVVVVEVFDTMLAAQFTGYPRPSLVSLVETHYNVCLPKTNQKADWSKRPLTPSMLEYAGNDSHYLLGIKDILEKELKKLKRYDWFTESCGAILENVKKKKELDPERLWRIKGSRDLKPAELVYLRELWQWRDKEAQRRDRPRFKVIANEQLLRITKWAASHKDKSIEHCKDIPPSFKPTKISSLDKVLQAAAKLPISSIQELKSKRPPRRFTTKQKTALQALKLERTKLSNTLRIDPSLIASNAIMESIVHQNHYTLDALQKSKLLLTWQYELAGKQFVKAMEPLVVTKVG